MKHIVNFSGGKDSTAMLLRMMELNYPIDEVINMDTGMEFPALYDHINKVKDIVESKGIKFTFIRADKPFQYYLLEHPYNSKKKNVTYKGYGWTRGRARWCTAFLKVYPYRQYIKKNYPNEEIITYVGIAADELYRLERESNKGHIHPLVDWGWSEKDALEYCYSKGFSFGGLYNIFKRVSCWCCPLQSMDELRKLRQHFPELWAELKQMESKGDMTFKPHVTLDMLEARFDLEKERERDGLTISPHTKEFRGALKELYSKYPPPPDSRF